jgi:Flp pilus assembly protein TadG
MTTKRTVRALRRLALRARLAEAGGKTEGAAAVEFGLLAPLLLVMVAGLIDFASYVSKKIELEQALRAGAQYALLDFTDSATITAAVTNATDLSPLTVSYDPATDTYCECPDGNVQVCPGDPTYSACASGDRPGLFITLTSSTDFDPMFADLVGLAENMTLVQTLSLRVR